MYAPSKPYAQRGFCVNLLYPNLIWVLKFKWNFKQKSLLLAVEMSYLREISRSIFAPKWNQETGLFNHLSQFCEWCKICKQVPLFPFPRMFHRVKNLKSEVEQSLAPKAVETRLHCLNPALWFIFNKPQCHEPKVFGSTLAMGRCMHP